MLSRERGGPARLMSGPKARDPGGKDPVLDTSPRSCDGADFRGFTHSGRLMGPPEPRAPGEEPALRSPFVVGLKSPPGS